MKYNYRVKYALVCKRILAKARADDYATVADGPPKRADRIFFLEISIGFFSFLGKISMHLVSELVSELGSKIQKETKRQRLLRY